MSASLREVALEAGVSGCTVSRILNNKASNIPVATQQRVRRIATDLGYVPNRFARNLGRSKTDTIGLMISGLVNPFFVEIMETAERESTKRGYQTLLDSAPSERGTFAGHSKLSGWPVDGIVMWRNARETITQYMGSRRESVPVVYIGGDPVIGEDVVTIDLRASVRLALDHLLSSGRRKISYLAPYPYSELYVDPRYSVYRDWCHSQGIEPAFIQTEGHQETRYAGMLAALDIVQQNRSKRPEAVICHNDVLAVGLNCGLRRSGLFVPDDIAIVGQEGIEEGQFQVQPITTVIFDVDQLCLEALCLLDKRIREPGSGDPIQIMTPVTLSVGATT